MQTRTLAKSVMRPIAPLACAWLVACAPSPVPSHAGLALALDPELELVSYSWDGGLAVPCASRDRSLALVPGEAGIHPHTRSYWTFDEREGTEVSDLVRAAALPLTDRVDGKFGAGVRIESGDSGSRNLSLGPGSAALMQPPASLSFWLRPGSLDECRVAAVPGLFDLRLERSRLRCELGDGQVLEGALRLHEWNFVGLAIDGDDYPEARLVVGDEPSGVPTEGALRLPDAGAALVLGEPAAHDAGPRTAWSFDLDELRIDGFARPTQELLEHSAQQLSIGPHELSLESTEGTQSHEVWFGIQREPILAGSALERGSLRFAAADELGLAWVPAQWELHRPAIRPRARTTHPTIHVGDHRVFLFGGEVRDTHGWTWQVTDDTWIYYTDAHRWERVEGSPGPSPRCHQDAAYSPDHDLVFLPGGWRNDVDPPVALGDIWLFSPRTGRWEAREPEGAAFTPTSNSSVVYDPVTRQFLVFRSGRTRVWTYDPESNEARLLPPLTASDEHGHPIDFAFRGSMMSGYDPITDTVVLFGGSKPRPTFFADTFLYDPRNNAIRRVASADGPSPRVRSAFAYDASRGYFVLFGGVRGEYSQRMSDLWLFDPADERWEAIDSSSASTWPTNRGGYYDMAYDADQDRFYVLCGRHAPRVFLDEAWSLALDREAVAEATYVFDRAGFEGLDRVFADFAGPIDSGTVLAWRAGPDGLTWGPWSSSADPEPHAPISDRFAMLRVHLGGGRDAPRLRQVGFADSAVMPRRERGDTRLSFRVTPLKP